MKRSLLLIMFAAFMLFTTIASAGVPKRINYQGYLADATGQPVEDGLYQIVFTIYNAADAPSGMWYSGIQDILVEDGLFEYQLGSTNALHDSVFADTSRWLGIRVVGDDEISPRTEFITVPYAFHALHADSAGYASAGGGWVDDGATMRLETSSDKVGIGFTSPTSKLSVMASGTDDVAYFQGAGQHGVQSYLNVQPGIPGAYSISGRASGGDGLNRGVYGLATEGYGGYGVYGYAWGNSNTSFGVFGEASDGGAAGLFHYGVYGVAENAQYDNYGVYAHADGNASMNVGLCARAEGTGSVNYGIYATASGGAENYAGHFGGNVECTDTIEMAGYRMATGASDGHVLTSDADGNGTWQTAGFGGSDAGAFDGVVNTDMVETDPGGITTIDFESPLSSTEEPHMFVTVVLKQAANGLVEGAAIRVATDIKGSPGNWTGFDMAVSKHSDGSSITDNTKVFVTWMAIGR